MSLLNDVFNFAEIAELYFLKEPYNASMCNDLHYMTAYKLHKLVSVGKDTYKYLDFKTDIEL
jgi:glyoxylate utilization-related uncharacterized protein